MHFCTYLFYNRSTTLYVSKEHFVHERNGRSKHVGLYKNCRINTYRKCILFVLLYNWL